MTKGGFWNEETIARLRDLAAEGFSAGEIAGAFRWQVSRNAVVGKMNRMGIPLAKGGDNKVRATRVKAAKVPRVPYLPPVAIKVEEPAPYLAPCHDPDLVTVLRPYTILTAPLEACRFFYGATAYVCGHKPAGAVGTIPGSYCDYHYRQRICAK